MPSCRILESLEEVEPSQWDALLGAAANPFVTHAFLNALESTGCVGTRTGWTPRHVTLWHGGRLAAAMPLYEKTHSYGEYVFDWAWARAYQQHGMDYYPKMLCAIPFTPVSGPRLLAPTADLRRALLAAAVTCTRERGASSLHILLPSAATEADYDAAGFMARSSVQFHWRNEGYADFEAFLATMNHAKRKKVHQERRRVRDAGVHFEWRTGEQASASDWDFFHRCYVGTYRAHGSSPYLNRRFFAALAEVMPSNLLLIMACRDGVPLASALNVFDSTTLYGRYWGCTEFVSGLHFETCYYQAIEFCIARAMQRFEGGAQGEHKLARGLLPVRTRSYHWISHPGFARAIGNFLQQEDDGIDHYVDELNEHSPYKTPPDEI